MEFKNASFGRHGSFQLRYGWLTKGFLATQKKPNNLFTSDDATLWIFPDKADYWS